MVPGPFRLSSSLSLSPFSSAPFLPSLFETFCRLAITRQSPLPFGPLMDAHCVGTVVPLCPMGCDQIHDGRLLAEKTRVQLCKSSCCHADQRNASFVGNLRKGKRTICLVLCFCKGREKTSSSPFSGYFFLFLFLVILAVALTDIRSQRCYATRGHLWRLLNKEAACSIVIILLSMSEVLFFLCQSQITEVSYGKRKILWSDNFSARGIGAYD